MRYGTSLRFIPFIRKLDSHSCTSQATISDLPSRTKEATFRRCLSKTERGCYGFEVRFLGFPHSAKWREGYRVWSAGVTPAIHLAGQSVIPIERD